MNDSILDLESASDRTSKLISPFFGTIPLNFLVQSPPHPCPYLPEKQSQEEIFIARELHPELYHDFMDHGFRRSGTYFYRTVCPNCRECRPIRIPVRDFKPHKSQRRVWKKNLDLEVKVGSPRFTVEKFSLYRDYLEKQHGAGEDSEELFKTLFYSSPVHTVEFEYILNKRIIAVSIADLSLRSLSSVYVYYDPQFAGRSLGTFSVLYEMAFCRTHGIPHYYLGFYISECPSMNYKAKFKPHDILETSLRWENASDTCGMDP